MMFRLWDLGLANKLAKRRSKILYSISKIKVLHYISKNNLLRYTSKIYGTKLRIKNL
jgi:hypothetical protein